MNVQNMSEYDPEFDEVDKALDQLKAIASEHFDVGIIMLSREKDGSTSYHSTEFGNKFAIRGIVESYVGGELDSEEIDDD